MNYLKKNFFSVCHIFRIHKIWIKIWISNQMLKKNNIFFKFMFSKILKFLIFLKTEKKIPYQNFSSIFKFSVTQFFFIISIRFLKSFNKFLIILSFSNPHFPSNFKKPNSPAKSVPCKKLPKTVSATVLIITGCVESVISDNVFVACVWYCHSLPRFPSLSLLFLLFPTTPWHFDNVYRTFPITNTWDMALYYLITNFITYHLSTNLQFFQKTATVEWRRPLSSKCPLSHRWSVCPALRPLHRPWSVLSRKKVNFFR